MIIIETCPKCGHDLRDEIITTNPPIPRKVCYNCGWSWEGHSEQVVRVPFGGNSYQDDNINLLNGDYLSLINNFTQPVLIAPTTLKMAEMVSASALWDNNR